MAATKRNAVQIDDDRREIASLYLHGSTQAQIAGMINASSRPYTLTQQMICYDLKRIREAWLESTLVDFDEIKAKQLAKIDDLEIEYWEAWVRSCEDAETHKEEDGKRSGFKTTKIVEGQAGDPRFLAGIQWCIERRIKLFGLDEPQEITVYDWRIEAQDHGLDPASIFESYVKTAYDAIKESVEGSRA